MRKRARVQLIGEVTGLRRSKVQAYFELRDGEGAVPCAIWLNELERLGLPEGGAARRRRSGRRRRARLLPRRRPVLAELLVPRHAPAAGRGGRPAREAGGAAQAAARRGPVRAADTAAAAAAAEDDRGRHGRVAAPLGATCSPACAARLGRDVVWAFAPVQDRHAAPAIAAALQDLAAGRGRGDRRHPRRRHPRRPLGVLRRDALPDRGDAAGAGDQRRRPRARQDAVDDVAAVACSTPTHAAEAAVPLDCWRPRRARRCGGAAAGGRRGRAARSQHLGGPARGPARARSASAATSTRRSARSALHPSAALPTGPGQRRLARSCSSEPMPGTERSAAANVRTGAARRRALGARAMNGGARRSPGLGRAARPEPERTLERGYALPGPRRRAGDHAAAAPPRGGRLRFADGE